MKVKCIYPITGHLKTGHLTNGKVYDVLEEDEGCYLIIDDLGDDCWFATNRFIEPLEDGEEAPVELFPIW